MTGESTNPGIRIRTFVTHCLRKPYGSNVMSLIWHCEPEKKIYCVETIVDDANKELPVEVCGRIPCHTG